MGLREVCTLKQREAVAAGECFFHSTWHHESRRCHIVLAQAPSEAEAQCAALAKDGAVYGTATEDMDALTFQTPKLLRRMTFSGATQPIMEIDYQKLLQVKSDRYLNRTIGRSDEPNGGGLS